MPFSNPRMNRLLKEGLEQVVASMTATAPISNSRAAATVSSTSMFRSRVLAYPMTETGLPMR